MDIQEHLSGVVKHLLRLQCIFLIEKEAETLKNRQLLKEIDSYVRQTQNVNIQQIILTIARRFTEKYFEEVKRQLTDVLKKTSAALGGDDLDQAQNILRACLITLEKRMFENLYNQLDQEPLYYLMVLNKFNFECIKSMETYRVDLQKQGENNFSSDCFTEASVVKVKSIDIFELIKYVYYNAIIGVKKVVSQRIFKQFLEKNAIKDLQLGLHNTDSCKTFIKRGKNANQTEKMGEIQHEKQLKIIEHLIKEYWKYLPDLKRIVTLTKDDFSGQLGRLQDEKSNNTVRYEDELEEEEDNIDWNYVVTMDGETVYLNAPTYKSSGEFHPVLARAPQLPQAIGKTDQTLKVISDKIKCHKPDAFDMKMEAILNGAKSLVGDEIGPFRDLTQQERVLSYLKVRRKNKRKQHFQWQRWAMFHKIYFTFEEPEEQENQGKSFPVRPNEFYDFIPRYIEGEVKPITFEFRKFRYLCAACGLFIEKGTGVEALGYKWHDNHFKCRICGVHFKQPSTFLLFRGIVLCSYDSDFIFGPVIQNKSVCRKN